VKIGNSGTLFPLPTLPLFEKERKKKGSHREPQPRHTDRVAGQKRRKYDTSAKTKAKCPNCKGTRIRTTVRHDGPFSYLLVVCDNVNCASIIGSLPMPRT
jgi:hypothetical protein